MPCDYSLYPSNWKTEIRPRILARAGEVRNENGDILTEARCEWCGAPNHSWRVTTPKRVGYIIEGGPWTPSDTYVVLTVAHLEHDATRCEDPDLAALCQKCHLGHDKGQHKATARRNREAGQIQLFREVARG
jgi:hypothetical protein